MKKLMLWAVLLMAPAVFAEDVVLKGVQFSGEECELTVHNVEDITPILGWGSALFEVSTPLQVKGGPKLLAEKSPTPYALYGRDPNGPDQIALHFRTVQVPKVDDLMAFTFQTYDETRGGLIQVYCRALHR